MGANRTAVPIMVSRMDLVLMPIPARMRSESWNCRPSATARAPASSASSSEHL